MNKAACAGLAATLFVCSSALGLIMSQTPEPKRLAVGLDPGDSSATITVAIETGRTAIKPVNHMVSEVDLFSVVRSAAGESMRVAALPAPLTLGGITVRRAAVTAYGIVVVALQNNHVLTLRLLHPVSKKEGVVGQLDSANLGNVLAEFSMRLQPGVLLTGVDSLCLGGDLLVAISTDSANYLYRVASSQGEWERVQVQPMK